MQVNKYCEGVVMTGELFRFVVVGGWARVLKFFGIHANAAVVSLRS